MLRPQLAAYWDAYLATLPVDAPQRSAAVDAWSFGDSPQLADELGGLVVAGIKTATCTALRSFEWNGETSPTLGQYSIILDGADQPLCIIETVEVCVCAFQDVDHRFAYDEGEQDRSLGGWRRAHWRYFTRVLARHDLQSSLDMPVVCERFRVVYC